MRRRRFLVGCAAVPGGLSVACTRSGSVPASRGPDAVHVASTAPAPQGRPVLAPADPTIEFAKLRGFCDGVEPPTPAEHAEARAAVQASLSAAGIAALVVEPGAAMTYLAGVRWGRSERPFLLIVPAEGEPQFVGPAFEARTAAEQLGDIALSVWQEHESPYRVLAGVLPRGRGAVAFDGAMRSFIVEGMRAQLARRKVVDGTDRLAAVRMRKRPAELSRLRRANEATKAALKAAAVHVRAGMRQSEIAALVRAAQQQAGLEDIWVLALAGPAAAFPHGTREDRVVAEGDLVLVDTGGALHGHRSDITRTWAVGTPSDEARRAWDTVHAAQTAALEAIRPGVTCGAIDAAARAVVEASGWGEGYAAFTHRLGHGIGLEVHEPPYLVMGSDLVLQEGMTMSVEPGIYLAGRIGVRIEDIIAVTTAGAEVFGPRVQSLDAPL
jgi:Xaa-Pro dipeptidase